MQGRPVKQFDFISLATGEASGIPTKGKGPSSWPFSFYDGNAIPRKAGFPISKKSLLACLLFFSKLCLGQSDSVRQLFEVQHHRHQVRRILDTKIQPGVLAESIVFDVTEQQHASGLLVRPTKSNNAFPVVIFMHWGGGDKTYFKEEAVRFAQKGFWAISLDAPWLWKTRDTTVDGLEAYPDDIILGIKAIRVLLNLMANETLYAGKAFFVGHSFGATLGGVLLGLEPGLQGAVLMAGLPSISRSIEEDPLGQWASTKQTKSKRVEAMVQRLRMMEPELFMGKSATPVFHQIALNDEAVTPQQSYAYIRSTKQLAKAIIYKTDHVFIHPQALQDRLDWLLQLANR